MAKSPSARTTARSRKAKSHEELHRWGPWVGLGLVLLVLCLGWLLLPLHEWMDGLQHWLLGMGLWGIAVFSLILIIATFLPMPDWPLPIVAGYVFGVWAFLLVYVGIALPSTIAFLAARYLARDRIRTFLGRRPKYRAVDRAVTKDGWQVVVLLRLSPVIPFNLQNYALGVTGIPFWQYLGATLLGIIPGVAIYVYLGIFGKGLGKGASALDWILLGIGIVATILLGVVVTRKTRAKFAVSKKSPRR
jgi:uncharacterized membrane protein YdjX (TVP38/TMEM64 family)